MEIVSELVCLYVYWCQTYETVDIHFPLPVELSEPSRGVNENADDCNCVHRPTALMRSLPFWNSDFMHFAVAIVDWGQFAITSSKLCFRAFPKHHYAKAFSRH